MVSNPNFELSRGFGTPPMTDNHIELRQQSKYLYGQPIAIQLGDTAAGANSLLNPPPYVHGEVTIRGNTIRLLDGVTDPIFGGWGILIGGAKKALVYDNIIDVPPPIQLLDARGGNVPYLNNRTAAGALVVGKQGGDYVPRTDLELEIDDAALLSI